MLHLECLTFTCLLAEGARKFAHRPCLSDLSGQSFTYAELHAASNSLGLWLQEQGIGFGDRVVLIAENCPHWGVAYYAITCMGAVVVPVLTEFHADAMAHIIRHSEAKAVFVSEKMLTKIEGSAFESSPLFLSIENFSIIDRSINLEPARRRQAAVHESRKVKDKDRRSAAHARTPDENDLAAIIYTSGTTGHSKGVMLSHKNIIADAMSSKKVETIYETDSFLSVLPLPHTYECTVGLTLPLLNGAQVTYLGKPPTARVLLPALAKVRPTLILTVPLVLEKIYKNAILPKLTATPLSRFLLKFGPTRSLLIRLAGKKLLELFGGRLRACAVSGAPLAADVERFLFEARFPYVIGYGLTEASPLVSATSIVGPRLGSTGQAVSGVSLRIDAPDPVTGVGEVLVKGPNVMLGYYKDEALTAETIVDNGWLRTGDLGALDADNYLAIRGRLKNMILGPSGENIYPEEIESFFFTFPEVAESMVFTSNGKVTARVHLDGEVLDSRFGHLPLDEQRAQIETLLENIRKKVNSKVSSFARINRIIQQAEPFEKTATQKIKRYLYVENYGATPVVNE